MDLQYLQSPRRRYRVALGALWGQSVSSRILTWSIRYSRSVAVFGPQTIHRPAPAHTYIDFYRRFNPLVILTPVILTMSEQIVFQ